MGNFSAASYTGQIPFSRSRPTQNSQPVFMFPEIHVHLYFTRAHTHARTHTRALVARVHPLSAVHSHINSKFILALGNLAASRTSACAWREKSVVTRTLIREHQAKKAPRECRNPQTHLRERTRDRPLFIVRPWRKVSRASFYTPGREVSTSPLRDGGRFPYRREISLHDRSINSLVTTSLQ